MTTLYVSDLDGTLLNSEKHLTDKTMNIINSLIDKGLLFTIATGRSTATTIPILSRLKINIPIILLNGVIIYDLFMRKCISVEILNHDSVNKMIDILNNANKTAFVYKLDGSYEAASINIYHGELVEKEEYRFYNKRVNYEKFIKMDKFDFSSEDKIIYFAMLNKFEILEPIQKLFQEVEDVTSLLYKFSYSDDYYFMEAFSSKASKNTGVQYLKQLTGADKVITFGDNINDIDMLINADESYAVSNACDEVKNITSEIIESNNDDGVAKFLSEGIVVD